eukprot:365362-Chlamydomonas_euryale.AAC.14
MQPATGGDATARPPLSIPGTCEAIAWAHQARYLGLMPAEDPSQTPHLYRRLAASGKIFKDLLPALRPAGSMRTRAMLYRVYVVPAILYAVLETCGLTDHQLEPLVRVHNAYLRRITNMGRRPDGTLPPLLRCEQRRECPN